MAFPVLLPRLGWTMEEGVLAEWLKRDGDAVAAGDILFTVENEKALNEVEAAESGILRIPPDSPQPGSLVPVGTVLAYIVAPGEAAPFESPLERPAEVLSTAETPQPRPQPTAELPDFGRDKLRSRQEMPADKPTISPRARRVAEALSVDWTQLRGSGRTGRIVERDVRAAVAARSAARPAKTQAVDTAAQADGQTRAPMSPARRTIARRMTESARTTVPVTLTSEVDATELVCLRAQLKDDLTAGRLPIPSYTDLFIKICAQALLEHPALNSRIEGDEIVTSSRVHIGFAVDTERGLQVPVVTDAQAKTLRQIAAETQSLIEEARTGQAAPASRHTGTFTLTNLGMYEIDAFTPVINPPECAVLGIGRARLKQVVLDTQGHTAVRSLMMLSLTFDHRLVDGAPAARFLQRVKELAEKPYLWLVT